MGLLDSWNTVRVHATWSLPDGSALVPGDYTVTVPRLTNSTDDVIIPAGTYKAASLNVTSGVPSLDIQVPATDDPDIEQADWKLTISVTLKPSGPTGKASTELYVIDVPVALSGDPNGIDLRQIALSQQIAPQIALYGVGVPGGLAKLSADGTAVLDADGNPITGGGGGASPTLANIPAGSTITVYWDGTAWKYAGVTVTARPTARTDVTVDFIDPVGTATPPAWALTGDLFDQVTA
jgi:hypothetical protein